MRPCGGKFPDTGGLGEEGDFIKTASSGVSKKRKATQVIRREVRACNVPLPREIMFDPALFIQNINNETILIMKLAGCAGWLSACPKDQLTYFGTHCVNHV